jgi:hypothetical protein
MNVTIELPDEKLAAWKAQAEAEGLTVERWLQTIADEHIQPASPPPLAKPVWEAITDRMKTLPPEAFEKLPTDGASEHDHYLYGHPKRNQ